MTNAELDALAKGLTKAQRRAVLSGGYYDDDTLYGSERMMFERLRAKGLYVPAGITRYRTPDVVLSPLGLALRNHLRAQEGSAGGGS